MNSLPRVMLEPLVRMALLEDLGRAGDMTSDAVIPPDVIATCALASRQPGVLAGLDLANLAFELIEPGIIFQSFKSDGSKIEQGDRIALISGPARGILTAERVALNYLCHLSGIATATASLVSAIAGSRAKIVCTRKTTPGLRALEKYAVRVGGGSNHRFGLDDAMLIKDNHIAIAGGVTEALRRAKIAAGHLVKIEIEVDTLDQLQEALQAGTDAILLDNMTPEMLKEAVLMVSGRAITEASGGITLASVPKVAASGVDLISVGWLTHSAAILDIGLDFAA